MECHDARPLIPGYLDGELSEAQAAPLRQHLLECATCRASAQDGKALKDWFVDEGPIEVPAGFAARVARRAFAGDRGEAQEPALPTGPRALEQAGEGRILSFVLQLTAVAAALLMALSIGMRAMDLPSGGELYADDASKELAIQELEQLNSSEEAAAEEQDAAEEDSE